MCFVYPVESCSCALHSVFKNSSGLRLAGGWVDYDWKLEAGDLGLEYEKNLEAKDWTMTGLRPMTRLRLGYCESGRTDHLS